MHFNVDLRHSRCLLFGLKVRLRPAAPQDTDLTPKDGIHQTLNVATPHLPTLYAASMFSSQYIKSGMAIGSSSNGASQLVLVDIA